MSILIHNPYQKLFQRKNSTFPGASIYWSVVRYHDTHQRLFFKTKLEAMMYEHSSPVPAQGFFHFYEDQFSRLNSAAEPEKTLAVLLKERAQELRDSYQYLRFWLSGGSDSMTALQAFVDNNIYIDEIVIHLYDNDDINQIDHFGKRALADVAFPYLQTHQDQLKNTKINVYRSDINTLERWHLDTDRTGEPAHLHGFDSQILQFRLSTTGAMLTYQTPDAASWCDIIGGTKPKLMLKNNRWYLYIIDGALLSIQAAETTEDFFVSKSVPTLFLKTAHLLKNHLETLNLNEEEVKLWGADYGKNSKKYNQVIGRILLPDSAYIKVAVAGSNKFFLDADNQYWTSINGQAAARVNKIFQHNLNTFLNTHQYMLNDMPDRALVNCTIKSYLSKFYCLDNGLMYDSTEI